MGVTRTSKKTDRVRFLFSWYFCRVPTHVLNVRNDNSYFFYFNNLLTIFLRIQFLTSSMLSKG